MDHSSRTQTHETTLDLSQEIFHTMPFTYNINQKKNEKHKPPTQLFFHISETMSNHHEKLIDTAPSDAGNKRRFDTDVTRDRES